MASNAPMTVAIPPFPIADEVTFTDLGGATWQDAVSLLEACLANRIPWGSDFNLRL